MFKLSFNFNNFMPELFYRFTFKFGKVYTVEIYSSRKGVLGVMSFPCLIGLKSEQENVYML